MIESGCIIIYVVVTARGNRFIYNLAYNKPQQYSTFCTISHPITMPGVHQHFIEFDMSLTKTRSLFHESTFGAEISKITYQNVMGLIKAVDSTFFQEITDRIQIEPTTDPDKILMFARHAHCKDYSYGRVFSVFTGMDRQLRYAFFSDTLVELDAENFIPKTLHQIFQKMQPKLPCPELSKFVGDRNGTYNKIIELELHEDPKIFMLTMINQQERKDMPLFVRKLQREIATLNEIFNVSNLHIELNPKKKRKCGTALCRWMDTLEISIMEIIVDELQGNCAVQHCIPVHDGVLINKDNNIRLEQISDCVFEATGFRYNFRLKPLKQKCNSVFNLTSIFH